MRPGPGLVVMALAFISGARRGSTSSISSKTTTTSSPPPPTLQILTTTTPASSLTLFQTTATTSPTSSSSFSFISSITTTTSTSTPPTTGDTITTTSSPPPPPLSTQPINIYENFGFFGSPLFKEQENDHQHHLSKRPKQPVPFNFFNTFFTRNSYNSYPSTSNYFAYTYPLPSHLTQHYDDPRARTESNTVLHSAKHTRRATTKSRRRRKRRTRSASVNYRGSGTGSDDAIENLNDSDDTLTSLTTAVDSSSDSALSDQTTLARGLPVHFPSLTAADSSRSLDEDDIFALVAEDDLLSEESFDHLVKLTNDKIGDTNEEDYSSGTETVVESSSGSGSGAPDNAHDTTDQQNAIEDFVRVHQHQHQQQQQEQEPDQQHEHNEHPQLQDDDDGDNGTKEKPNEDHDSEQDDVDTVYTAHLVGNSNEKVVSVAETDSTHSSDPDKVEKENKLVTATTTTTTTTTTHPKAELDSPNRYHTILGSNFALTRLNPWISACDLAQPGPLSAPDLQGECSAGTLPVAKVDEGPGPPTCLKSCKEETPFTNKLNKDNMINNLINNNNNNNSNNNNNNNNSKQNKNKSDNKLNKLVGYTTTTNTFNIKLRNSQPTISHSMNTNNNNNNNKHMDNNNNNSNNNKSNMKLLNPFNYYQINNYNTNNNKMAKIRRNSKETTSATSNHSDVASRTTITNVTTQRAAHNDSQSQALSTLHSSEDYELLHDMLMQQDEAATNTQQNQQDQYNDDGDHQYHHHQFNDAAIAAAAVVMQLNQQQQQHNNNNNIVKMKLTATNYDDNNSNYNSNHFELKYNHLKKLHAGNSNSNNNNNNNNNNRRYQSNNNINNSQQRFNTSSTIKSHAVAANNDNSDQYLKIPPPEKQQQQCLEYLGDSETTMPTHLCHFLTPSDRLAQLRHLRLRNCCERNVYSALHTMALNATLSGGTGCLRVLQDLMDLDALASRITCGLTDILFRFDCRQVYSIIHQCDDCKEAYRRWVCSTLVPYFAETSDVMRPPEILTTTIDSTSVASGSSNHVNSPKKSHKSQSNSLNRNSNSSNNTTMASNMTTSHTTATSPNNKNNKNGTDMSSAMPTKTATSNFITNSNNNKHDMQYNANNYQQHFYMQQQQQQHHVKRRNIQMQQQQQQQQLQQHIINHILIDNNNNNNNSSSNNNTSSKINDIHYETILIHHKNQPQQLHPSTITQALIFNDIITLNPRTTSPRNPLRSTTARLHSINATNEPAFGLNLHHKSTNKRRKRSDNSTTTTIYADVVVNRPSMSSSSPPSPSSSHASSTMHQMQRQKQQSFNFISTANNEDSFYDKNPVITKLLKRSKRKEFEFRKRRRIRPCLSVCQTVEQKCPYLLPADRAPSMPTQYAGEPTFLCLDYNIAETEEQLSKASHGPNECCYTYCSSSPNGICTYCNDMWDKTETDKEAEILSEERETKVLNIKMKPKGRAESEATIRVETRIQQKMGEEKNGLKMSTVAIEVRNDTAFENATRLAERLQYYAFCDGVFYYDDDADDMPEYPNSENCRALPPVQIRCTIPYYATNYISSADMLGSYRKNNEAKKLLIWLSTLLCLWSCYSARSMRLRRCHEDKRQQKTDQQQLTHQQQQQHKTTNTAYRGGIMCQSCETREIMQNEGNCKKVIKLWYDDKECRIIIIYWLKIGNGTALATAASQHKKSLREKHLLVRNFRQILHCTSVQVNLKILEIPSLILLINYKEILLLLFKKRQKLRKRKFKNVPCSLARITTTDGKCWPQILTDLRSKNIKSKTEKFSFKYKIHYYYYYDYYYCSCRQIFSCSCNKNIINNYYNNNNNKRYIKRFKYNFSTCNLNKNNINTNNNKNHKNNNSNNKNNKNKMIIMKINYKKVSIIKFNTTTTTTTTKTKTTTTHIFIINSYNNNKNISSSNSNSNKTNYYNIITIIIISYNVYNTNTNNYNNNSNRNSNNNQQQILNSFSSITNNQHQHYHQHYYYDYYNYTSLKYKPNNNRNITVLFKTFTLLTSTLKQILMTDLILKIMTTIMIMPMIMLIMLIMPLLFKSFLKMKYNNNHHMKNIKSNLSFSPNTSYNSEKTNYRYFYYYNFNINDWWQRRRWWRRRRRPSTPHPLVDHHYATESLLMSGVSSQPNFFQHILL